MAQVSGKKVNYVPASKNLGTVINNQVSGSKVDAKLEYNKITDVAKTQLYGQQKLTNYMGINDEGMNIFEAKKVTGNELNVQTNPTIWDGKAAIISAANTEIIEQEEAKKAKNHPVVETPTEPENPSEGEEGSEDGEGSEGTEGEE